MYTTCKKFTHVKTAIKFLNIEIFTPLANVHVGPIAMNTGAFVRFSLFWWMSKLLSKENMDFITRDPMQFVLFSLKGYKCRVN